MKRFVMDVIGGLAIVGMGALVFFDPKLIWRRLPFISLTERNRPLDESERIVGKVIGACIALMGLAYTVGMAAEHLAA